MSSYTSSLPWYHDLGLFMCLSDSRHKGCTGSDHSPIPIRTSKLAAAQARSAWRPGPRLGISNKCSLPQTSRQAISHASRPSITKYRKAFRTCLIRVDQRWDQSCKLRREPRPTSNVGCQCYQARISFQCDLCTALAVRTWADLMPSRIRDESCNTETADRR